MKKTLRRARRRRRRAYAWSGNDEVGEGKMTITESVAPSSVTLRLEFIKPFAATNTTTFSSSRRPAARRSRGRWRGENTFIGKAFGLFMDMDKMVGADFEKGLGAMKQNVESKAAPPS